MRKKEYVRVQKAIDRGVVFFIRSFETKSYELRLDGKRLIYIRLGVGGENGGRDTCLFVLKKLNWYEVGKRKIKFSGEFYYKVTDKRVYDLKEDQAFIRHATISVRRPLENEEKLEVFLERFLKKSESIEATSYRQIMRGWIKHALPDVILLLIVLLIGWLAFR